MDFSKSAHENILDHLRSGVCAVKFIKKNGEHRVMQCTLNMDFIPESKRPTNKEKEKEKEKENKTSTAVFDVDIQEWRSFVNENVLYWYLIT